MIGLGIVVAIILLVLIWRMNSIESDGFGWRRHRRALRRSGRLIAAKHAATTGALGGR